MEREKNNIDLDELFTEVEEEVKKGDFTNIIHGKKDIWVYGAGDSEE